MYTNDLAPVGASEASEACVAFWRPYRGWIVYYTCTPGSAALHPGLITVSPTGEGLIFPQPKRLHSPEVIARAAPRQDALGYTVCCMFELSRYAITEAFSLQIRCCLNVQSLVTRGVHVYENLGAGATAMHEISIAASIGSLAT